MKISWIGILLLFSIMLINCTPKVVEQVPQEQVVEEKPQTEEVEESLSGCPKFTDAPDPDGIETTYVLYRDAIKMKDISKAYNLWQQVYETAPAADGKRNTVFSDGIYFYETFLAQTTDSLKKEEYITGIFKLYDQLEECYPEDKGYASGRRAFDYYYKYPNRKTKEELYGMFKSAIDTDGMEANDFVLNPFTSLLTELYEAEKVSFEEAKQYEQFIRQRIAKGLKECRGTYCERWKIVEEYSIARLRYFETVKGFYGCDYYKAQYYQDFLASQDNCDTVRLVFSRLKWGGCPDDDPQMAQVKAVGNEKCVEKSAPSSARIAYDCLQNADYTCAVENFQKAADETDDVERKGRYLLLVSKIYYSHLRNFSEARRCANQAASARSNWGEPYILIGKLYASSGPLCGPGRGWDSQIVTWPAIDMWRKAKQVDASVAAEANKNIANYTKYMPSKEDIFQRGLKEGDSFFVPCWIQASTTVRAAPY